MLHVMADEMVDTLRLDFTCDASDCHEYVTTVFDWVADWQAWRTVGDTFRPPVSLVKSYV